MAESPTRFGEYPPSRAGWCDVRWWQVLAVVFLVSGLVGCDHATKRLAATELRDAPTIVVPGILELTYRENRDSAFSLLYQFVEEESRYRILVTGVAVGSIVAALGLVLRWRRSTLLEKVALATLLGGALGNLADRVLLGYVIDWVYLIHWPVFNVADVAITCGLGLWWLASSRDGVPTPMVPPPGARGATPPGS
ncbi:MAG: signal peptidase II [Polyangiaceae bacterium]|nr:signal peptidase II [Polyangiaceae bacterium]